VKKSVVLGTVLLSGLITLAVARPASASVSVSLSFFHESLSPHGRWVATTSYGQVWVPAVSAGWEPYVDGEWLYTDWGWTWASNDPWGDIPYHYGTWVWVSRWGWVWVPGTVWAPAWVTWAYTDDFVGWAPVPPSFVLTASGYWGRPIVVSETRYVFVPARQFVGVPVSSVRVPVSRNPALFARANKVTEFRVSNGIVRNVGVAPTRIEKAAGHRIERTSIDRTRIRPATLAESGIARTSRVAVVAPASERSRALRGKPAESRPAENRPDVRSAHERNAPKPAPAVKPAPARRPESKEPAALASRANEARPPNAAKAKETKRPKSPKPTSAKRPEPAPAPADRVESSARAPEKPEAANASVAKSRDARPAPKAAEVKARPPKVEKAKPQRPKNPPKHPDQQARGQENSPN
jgi:uncharacterized protein DUF6600